MQFSSKNEYVKITMDDFEEFIDWIEENQRLPKRYIRDMENPFEFYSNTEFKKRFRFSKATVRDGIYPLIENSLAKNSNRGLPISPILQLFMCLRFYATGSFQMVSGDLFKAISQSTVSVIIKRVSEAIATHLEDYVKFPVQEIDNQRNITKFHQIVGFPCVSSCIDGTHIIIKNPGGEMGEVFRNRKLRFSINVQIACGPNMEILDIIARHPGSMHDNVIFNRSSLRVKYENNRISGIILGDNGYACRRYLLTPVIEPANQAERNYNRAHRQTRNIIERLFGIWKSRFRCLRGLMTKLETSVTIICTLAVLHNIAISRADILDEPVERIENEDMRGFIIDNHNADGNAYRRAFIQVHF